MKGQLATGVDFEPLPNGNVLIEFFGDYRETFYCQQITTNVLGSLPFAALLCEVVQAKGPEVAPALIDDPRVPEALANLRQMLNDIADENS